MTCLISYELFIVPSFDFTANFWLYRKRFNSFQLTPSRGLACICLLHFPHTFPAKLAVEWISVYFYIHICCILAPFRSRICVCCSFKSFFAKSHKIPHESLQFVYMKFFFVLLHATLYAFFICAPLFGDRCVVYVFPKCPENPHIRQRSNRAHKQAIWNNFPNSFFAAAAEMIVKSYYNGI